jgi:hypothetical protein
MGATDWARLIRPALMKPTNMTEAADEWTRKPSEGAEGEAGEAVGGGLGEQGAQAGAGGDAQAVGHDVHAEDEQREAAQHFEDQKECFAGVIVIPEGEGRILRKFAAELSTRASWRRPRGRDAVDYR